MRKRNKKMMAYLLAIFFLLTSVLPVLARDDLSEVLFAEDFADGNYDGWIHEEGSDTWYITELNGKKWLANGATGSNIISVGNKNWTDYSVECDFVICSDERVAPGLLFRYSDNNNFYMMAYSASDKRVDLHKRVEGSFTVIGSKAISLEKNTEYTMTINVKGDKIQGYIDDTLIISVSDTQYSSGCIGFRNVFLEPNTSNYLGNITVKTNPEIIPEDQIPPDNAIFHDAFGQEDLRNWNIEAGGFEIEPSDGGSCLVPQEADSVIISKETISEDNYRFGTILSAGTGKVGQYLKYVSESEYYQTELDYENEKIILYKGGTKVVEEDVELAPDTIYTLDTTANEGSVRCHLNGRIALAYRDENPITEAGKVGLYSKGAERASFVQTTAFLLTTRDDLPGEYVFEPAPDRIPYIPQPGSGDFFVSTQGNDSWSGLLAQPNESGTDGPFATLSRASEAVKQAIDNNPDRDYTVYIRGGQYYLENTLELEHGGSNQNRVTYCAYPNEKPVISGGTLLDTTWENIDGNMWKTTLSEEFDSIDIRQLFVEGERAIRSREPDNGTMTVREINHEAKWLTVTEDIPQTWEGLNNVEVHSRGTWHFNRQLVESFNADADRVNTKLFIGVEASGVRVNPGEWVYFENALIFVDEEDEWFYDKESRELYYMAGSDVDPNELEMIIPRLETLVRIKGTRENPVQNIDIYGLTFEHTTWSMPEDIERRGIQAGFWGSLRESTVYAPPAALMYENVTGSRIQNCLFRHLGEGAIAFGAGCHSNLIHSNEMVDVGANVIQVGYRESYLGIGHPLEREWDDDRDAPRGNEIINNYIHDCCTTDQASVGIWVGYANYTLVESNSIINMPYSGINIGWRWSEGKTSSHHNIVQWNYVENVMITMLDGGGIYAVGEQFDNKILNNYIYKSTGAGLYCDERTNYTEVAYNYVKNAAIPFAQNQNLTCNDYHDNYFTAPEDETMYGCKIDETQPLEPSILLKAIPSVKGGQLFGVEVALAGVSDSVYSVYVEDITIHYDSTLFGYVDVNANEEFTVVNKVYNDTVDTLRVVLTNNQEVNGYTNLFTALFRAEQVPFSTSGVISVTNVDLMEIYDGEVINLSVKNDSITVRIDKVDKSQLAQLIADALAIYNEAVEGTYPGQYPTGSKEIFMTEISQAQAVVSDEDANQAMVDNAADLLQAAMEAFQAKQIEQRNVDINGDGKVDIGDIAIASYYYNRNTDSEDWDEAQIADLNYDGIVEIDDMVLIAEEMLGKKNR